MSKQVLEKIETSKVKILEDLKTFLRFASVSADPKHAGDVRACADWLLAYVKKLGLSARLVETGTKEKPGHPILLAKNEHKAGRPTVLFYGHYDVQPPDPLDLWKSGAFEPVVVKDGQGNEALVARGSADDKGQVWCHIAAIEAWNSFGGVPVNMTLVIEGEEEVGSEHLEQFISDHAAELKADIAVISDTSLHARGVPAVCYGLRGLVYEEVFLSGPSHDLHSGGYGGAVTNPANALARLMASLHDPATGRVTVPGFYDDVQPLSEQERNAWAKLPGGDAAVARESGVKGAAALGGGEKGYSAYERTWARPTCDVNGLTSGYQGPGAKTVLPAKASAKVSFRLVPNQDPQKIRAAFERMMRENCPAGIEISFENHGASPASVTPLDTKYVKLTVEALKEGFNAEATFIRSGGSIPVVGTIKRKLGIDTLLMGFGLPDDRVHSPNEKFELDCLYGGARAAAVLYGKLGEKS